VNHTTTKDRILDAAERLFGDLGFADTSLRAITAEAGANLAAVNYYFQSKDALIQAVFARRLGPINKDRLAMLDDLESRAAGRPLAIEDILRAFLTPVFRAGRPWKEHQAFGRMFGRMYIDPGDTFTRIFREQLGEVKTRFITACQRAMPGLPPEELYWRLHFLIGSLAHTIAGLHHLAVTSEGCCDPSNPEAILERLIAFLAAGFRAPVPTPQGDPQCHAN
jgi:AcrR family transcriptional regulator